MSESQRDRQNPTNYHPNSFYSPVLHHTLFLTLYDLIFPLFYIYRCKEVCSSEGTVQQRAVCLTWTRPEQTGLSTPLKMDY